MTLNHHGHWFWYNESKARICFLFLHFTLNGQYALSQQTENMRFTDPTKTRKPHYYIAGRTARCRCKLRYVSNFTMASCGFPATARLSCNFSVYTYCLPLSHQTCQPDSWWWVWANWSVSSSRSGRDGSSRSESAGIDASRSSWSTPEQVSWDGWSWDVWLCGGSA